MKIQSPERGRDGREGGMDGQTVGGKGEGIYAFLFSGCHEGCQIFPVVRESVLQEEDELSICPLPPARKGPCILPCKDKMTFQYTLCSKL